MWDEHCVTGDKPTHKVDPLFLDCYLAIYTGKYFCLYFTGKLLCGFYFPLEGELIKYRYPL